MVTIRYNGKKTALKNELKEGRPLVMSEKSIPTKSKPALKSKSNKTFPLEKSP